MTKFHCKHIMCTNKKIRKLTIWVFEAEDAPVTWSLPPDIAEMRVISHAHLWRHWCLGGATYTLPNDAIGAFWISRMKFEKWEPVVHAICRWMATNYPSSNVLKAKRQTTCDQPSAAMADRQWWRHGMMQWGVLWRHNTLANEIAPTCCHFLPIVKEPEQTPQGRTKKTQSQTNPNMKTISDMEWQFRVKKVTGCPGQKNTHIFLNSFHT